MRPPPALAVLALVSFAAAALAQTQVETAPAGVPEIPNAVVAPLSTTLPEAAATGLNAALVISPIPNAPIPLPSLAGAQPAIAAPPAVAPLSAAQSIEAFPNTAAAPPLSADEALTADEAAAARGDKPAARRAAADRLIVAAGRNWTADEYLASAREAAGPPSTLAREVSSNLRFRARLYAAAARDQYRGKNLLDIFAADLVLTPTAARLQSAAEKVDSNRSSYLDRQIAQERIQGRMALLRQIKGYIPSLNPDRTTDGQGLLVYTNPLGHQPAGNATPLQSEAGLVWVDKDLDTARFIAVAAHEGIHMGDAGYETAEKAATMLLGEAGKSLNLALIEGYTERRTREFTDRLDSEAAAGVSGLPQEFGAAVRGRAKRSKDARAEWLSEEARHPYDPYVRMADAIAKLPGGRAALDAYVSRGDIAPLYFLLGREKLERLAEIAASADRLVDPMSSEETILAQNMGLRPWILEGLSAVAAGSSWPEEEISRRAKLARRLLVEARGGIDAAPSFSREGALWAMAELDLGRRLDAGDSPESVVQAIADADRARGLRRYLPDAAVSSWKKPFFQYLTFGALLAVPAHFYPGEIAAYLSAHHIATLSAESAAVVVPLFLLAYFALGGAFVSLRNLKRNAAAWLPSLLRRAARRRRITPPPDRPAGT